MSLRDRVFRGGFYLMLRQGLSVLIGLGGMLLLTRLIGPAGYGLYAGALGLMVFLSLVAKMGVDVYLIRREDEVDEAVYHQAFTFLLLSGLSLSAVGLILAPIIVEYWMEDLRFLAPLQVLLLSLTLTVLYLPAVARLERALDYQKVAGIELAGQLLYYALALPLAWRGFGVWAPVAGYFLNQAWALGAGCVLARYRPRLLWSWKLLHEMLRYSLGYSSSVWVWQVRMLINPLIVGRYVGPEGVGYVALTIRLVEALSFARTATWRISIAALAKVQQDLPRLRRALEEAMGLQVLALGPLLAGFALLAPWLLPLLFGDRWSPVLLVYPFVALAYLVNAVFSMHSSVLYVLQRNWSVTAFHAAHIALFAGAAFLLVPGEGLLGYGLAEIVAFAGYPVIHLCVSRLFGFGYNLAWPWLLAFAPTLFLPLVGFPWGLVLCIFPFSLVFNGAVRAQVREYWLYIKAMRTK